MAIMVVFICLSYVSHSSRQSRAKIADNPGTSRDTWRPERPAAAAGAAFQKAPGRTATHGYETDPWPGDTPRSTARVLPVHLRPPPAVHRYVPTAACP